MRINKRKVLLWIVAGMFAVAFAWIVATLVQAHRTGQRLASLQSQQTAVSERIARLATRYAAAPPPAPLSTVASSTMVASISGTPAPISRAELAREFAALSNEYWTLDHAFREAHDSALGAGLSRGLDGLTFYLSAADFPEEGRRGALRGGAALRERIRKEVLMRKAFEPPPATQPRITSATLAAHAQELLDRTANILRRPWDGVGPTTLGLSMAYGMPGFKDLAPAAVEREARAGRVAEARLLLESLVHNYLLLRLGGCPSPAPWYTVQRTVFHMAEQEWLDDAGLARIDRMLAQAHLSAAQLADLRAAWALQVINMFEDGLKQELTRDGRGDGPWTLRRASLQGARMMLENTLYAAMLAWVSGDGGAYDRALKGPLSLTFVLPKVLDAGFCPPAMSAFEGSESAGNDDIDLLRLVVAAARYRLAWGRYPARTEDLIPRYLDPDFIAAGGAIRAVDWVRIAEKKPFSGVPVAMATTTTTTTTPAERPIFFVARRMTMTPLRSRVSHYSGFASHDETGMDNPTSAGWLLSHIDNSLGLGVDLMSSRSADAIAVWLIWPRTEDVDWGWLDGVGHSAVR